ncbi:unnamed protein product [Urochloa decumbens]|uniref:RIN4 pathogenic type III effector avirulence factor Avr cleavage site domain-containing protein n=1 Tax=Urochloa decumbens TaxID=240449 RepID=A0ABC9CSK0_9POAL
MATMPDKPGRPLPKFGEWDVKNPASSEGFTVIFQKARDGKKTTGGPGRVHAGIPPAFRDQYGSAGDGGYGSGDSHQYDTPPKRVNKVLVYHVLRAAMIGLDSNLAYMRALTRGAFGCRGTSGRSVAADSKVAAAAAAIDRKGGRPCIVPHRK